jgi:hypothetical protein
MWVILGKQGIILPNLPIRVKCGSDTPGCGIDCNVYISSEAINYKSTIGARFATTKRLTTVTILSASDHLEP